MFQYRHMKLWFNLLFHKGDGRRYMYLNAQRTYLDL
jgi:hypothetical protein